MEKQPEFKKNLWGYDKEAVLKYIDEMSRTAAQSEAALQEKVSQIAHSREELEGQIAEFEQKLQHITCPPFRLQILQEQQALRSHWFYRHS